MNAKEFAMATGFTQAHIQRACKKGEIKCTKKGKAYDIPISLIPAWKAKKNVPKERKKKGIDRCSREYQNELDIYNARNGTEYSYGEAVAKGVLCDE